MDTEILTLPRHLRSFVNRTGHLNGFRRLAGTFPFTDAENIIILHGSTGMGKTILVERLIEEAKHHQCLFAHINFEDDFNKEPIRVLSRICEQLEDADTHFSRWLTKAEEFAFGPLRVQADLNVTVDESQPGSINIQSSTVNVGGDLFVGNMVEVRNNQINFKQSTLDPRIEALTENFLELLRHYIQSFATTAEKTVIFLFDGLDDVEHHTMNWFWYKFLAVACQYDGTLFILTAQEDPRLGIPAVNELKRARELEALKKEDFIEYMRLKHVPEDELEAVAEAAFASTNGTPAEMAYATDLYFQAKKKDEDDAW